MKLTTSHCYNLSLNDISEEINGIVYTEEWSPIDGYEGIYFVSNFGRVISIGLKRNGYRNKILKHSICRQGYHRVGLYNQNTGIQLFKGVHVLVAKAFISNPNNLPEVNHLWGIKLDNRFTQLEWSSASNNQKHAFRIGAKTHSGESNPKCKLNNDSVREIFVSKMVYKNIASDYGISVSAVVDIKRGRRWSHVTGKKYFTKKELNDRVRV